jgi:hypothetical protein
VPIISKAKGSFTKLARSPMRIVSSRRRRRPCGSTCVGLSHPTLTYMGHSVIRWPTSGLISLRQLTLRLFLQFSQAPGPRGPMLCRASNIHTANLSIADEDRSTRILYTYRKSATQNNTPTNFTHLTFSNCFLQFQLPNGESYSVPRHHVAFKRAN